MKSLLVAFGLIVFSAFLMTIEVDKKEKTWETIIIQETSFKSNELSVWKKDSATTEEEFNKRPLTADLAPISRLVIPAINVDAPLEEKGLDENLKMEDPSTSEVVAWYDLSSKVDLGNNVVLAGHKDLNRESAVFEKLDELRLRDIIILKVGSAEFKYRVVRSSSYPIETIPMDVVLDRKTPEYLTLISCDGLFISPEKDYSHRRVIGARRIN